MLSEWGWDEGRAALSGSAAAAEVQLARVTGQERDRFAVQLEGGAANARIVSASFAGPLPVTGDWITVRPGPLPADPYSVVDVLPRHSALSRGSAGGDGHEQVLASNIDVIWIVHGLDLPPNLRRLERYLAAAWESGAVPEIVLTKADLAPDASLAVAEVESVAMGARQYLVSVEQADSVGALRAQLRPGVTVALLGPSGAGKSTLINALAGAELALTGAVRDFDRKGRHTTTRRELFQLPGGALLMDTPGLREFRVWSLDEGLEHAFPDIEELAASCHFRDCSHELEPGCSVLAAVASGALPEERIASYRKLRSEAAYLERRSDPLAQAASVAKHKTALKTMKYHHKYRGDA